VLARKLHQRVGLIRQVVQVPGVVHVLHLTSIHKLLAASSEARAEFLRRQISRIFHGQILIDSIFHLTPIVSL
jgi:hypothetical protein